MRDPNKSAATTDPRVSSPTVPSDTNLIPEPAVPRDDDYYKTLYKEELDFGLLGRRDPQFQAALERGSHLNFSDASSVMQLTKTVLKLDFGLHVDLPMDRLCPPVPNRHNYILWLKDLLDSSSPSYLDSYEPTPQVTGLDIGTGASTIYPLLGCIQRPSWSFIATDVDAKSLAYARRNVELNNLQSQIRVVDRTITDYLIPLDELGLEAIDFVMTNPPFYTSEIEMADLARQKSRPPNSACTGAPIEMVCAGGEIGFVRRIIDESLTLRERVRWYTSMLGKQSSLELLIGVLKDHGVTNYAVTAFVQGNKTRRWAVGWSFGNRRPSLLANRGCEPAGGKKLLPPSTETKLAIRSMSQVNMEQLERAICDTMKTLDLASWTWDKPGSRGVGFVDSNVWSRAYRRKRGRETTGIANTHLINADGPSSPKHKQLVQKGDPDIAQCAFGFSITVQVSRGIESNEDSITIMARWLQGNDYTLFESFTGFLRKSIAQQQQPNP
ncbi:hypothetical protein F4819DRAFT_484475 [Hypoxylon fuscum]|nr:hypothetical protein F4819DRAFT_484475 [Hypoxylon fuscum]